MTRSCLLPTLAALLGFAPALALASGGSSSPATNGTPQGLSDADWSDIRAACEADRHAVVAVEGDHRAHNPGQRWTTSFDGRGFTTRPDAGGWTWGLELVSFGFEGRERGVAGRACTIAEGGRLAYEWDESLSEWYVNDARGLEHGYTLRKRPPGTGTLAFTLVVRGGLVPRVQTDGLGVSFSTAYGSALTYAGLAVLDADGRALPAGIEPSPEGLRLLIDERGARYPLTIDPIAQQAYLKASNTGAQDCFGYSVAIAGDTVVVGALLEDSSATGVDGNQADNSATGAGAAYVFVRSGATWAQQAYLKASNTEATDRFGASVAISGDTIVVGAYRENSNATGIDGNQADNSAPDSGAVYVFVRNGAAWAQQAYLKASNTGAGDEFGGAVAVTGNTLVVGATGEDSSATGVNGNQASDSAPDSGAVYVFVRNGATWSQQAYLKASNTNVHDLFGAAVAISGDLVVVGAVWEDSNATGVNGNQTALLAPGSGAVYVFVHNGATWTQQAYLKASNTGVDDSFGGSVAVTGDTLVVGATGEDSSATGVNGNQTDNSLDNAGAAYLFVRSGATWSQQAYLKASNTDQTDNFGGSVAALDHSVLVGAWNEESNATGVNGDQSNNSVHGSGAAYLFTRSGSTWSQQAYLKASNTGWWDEFGYSVAMSGDMLAIGAWKERSNATGVDGDQSNNSAIDAGAVYVFLTPQPGVGFCFGDGTATACPCGNASAVSANEGCLHSLGTGGKLVATGTASLADDSVALLGTRMPNSGVLYIQGTSQVNGGLGVAFGDGLRCAGGTIFRLGTATNVSGASQYPVAGDPSVSVRGAVVLPGTRTYQVWYRNAATFCTPGTFNLTNGVSVVWGP